MLKLIVFMYLFAAKYNIIFARRERSEGREREKERERAGRREKDRD